MVEESSRCLGASVRIELEFTITVTINVFCYVKMPQAAKNDCALLVDVTGSTVQSARSLFCLPRAAGPELLILSVDGRCFEFARRNACTRLSSKHAVITAMILRVFWYAARQVVMKPAYVEATSLSARLVAILASNAKMIKQVTLTYNNSILTLIFTWCSGNK